MARRQFNPDQAKGDLFSTKESPSSRREKKRFSGITETDQLTVSQVSDLIKGTLEQRLPSPLRVVGEVSNLSVRNHWYFSLKDDKSVLSSVAWASSARKFGFTPSDGDEVVATGHISHYGPQGRTQLYVSKLDPVGAGALELAFRRMCETLRGLGYFDDTHKIPLPAFPRRIAVITSATGAAVQDVIATAAHRCMAVGLLIVDVRVQGEGAAEEIARTIRWIDQRRDPLSVDAILVTRGGGSLEDLWAFNERVVAEATYDCELPIVAAIGHESDTTIIELVADLRAATPTQAAMRLVPSAEELHSQLDHGEQRLNFLIQRRLERARERLNAIERSEMFRMPRALFDRERKRLDQVRLDLARLIVSRLARDRSRIEQLSGRWERIHPRAIVSERHRRLAVLSERMDRLVAQRLMMARQRLDAFDRELIAVDPRQVLTRGFSYTTDRTGRLIRKVADARAGQVITTHVSDGAIESVVGGTRTRGRPKPATVADQMDLFAPAE